MTDYKSPIEVIIGGLNAQIEDGIIKAVRKYAVNVDKEELIKALEYDRDQYSRGFMDGKRLYEEALENACDKLAFVCETTGGCSNCHFNVCPMQELGVNAVEYFSDRRKYWKGWVIEDAENQKKTICDGNACLPSD